VPFKEHPQKNQKKMAEGIGCPGCFIAKAEAVGFFSGPSKDMGPLWAKFPTLFP